MKLYSFRQVDELIQRYTENGGIAVQTDEGCLASGDWVLTAPVEKHLYSFVIKEVYLNEWSSAQTIRRYKVLPKKYQQLINEA